MRTEFLHIQHDDYEACMFAEFIDDTHLQRVLSCLDSGGYRVRSASPEEFQQFTGKEESFLGGSSHAVSVIRERAWA